MHFEEWILFQKLAWRGVAASSISGKSTGASSTCGSWNHELLQHPLTLPAGIVHHLSGPNTYAPNSNFWTERPSLFNSYSEKNLIPTQKRHSNKKKVPSPPSPTMSVRGVEDLFGDFPSLKTGFLRQFAEQLLGGSIGDREDRSASMKNGFAYYQQGRYHNTFETGLHLRG